jgi:hypothetical protein
MARWVAGGARAGGACIYSIMSVSVKDGCRTRGSEQAAAGMWRLCWVWNRHRHFLSQCEAAAVRCCAVRVGLPILGWLVYVHSNLLTCC